MTAAREAIVLPVIFLTVFLLGGLRIATPSALVFPSLVGLVLGILLLRLLVQSGALDPAKLLLSSRSSLANVNGLVVLATLWLAASQMFGLLTPESGLPRLAFTVLFVVMLLNTAAAGPDRPRLLRSLAVMFGAAFVLKFVVLFELSEPGTGWFKQVLLAALEGITLGALLQDVPHPVTGYLAFLTTMLFLIGVFLLPPRQEIRGPSAKMGPFLEPSIEAPELPRAQGR